MNKSILKLNTLLKIFYNSLIILPTPINISIWWNFGSILGMCLMIQIISGLFLSMHFCPNTELAFSSTVHIMQNINMGWLMRILHMNGASLFFFSIYMHMARGIYYKSYLLLKPWISGIFIYLLVMMTAFMGYVLPWGQMSFWGATVITNLMSTIPYIGFTLVEWLWGGFSVNNPTLNRFFSFHFIMPFIVLALVIIHLMFIHETGSNNPMGLDSNLYKIPFHNYFTLKDILGFLIMLTILLLISLFYPYMLSDPDNFLKSNPMITPIHIQPEWYFLFAYTILRSIPNKLGGVIALLMSILILLIMPFYPKNKFQSMKFYPLNQYIYWFFINFMLMLTWLGSQPVEMPFIWISQMYTILYFSFFMLNPLMFKIWDKLI